MATQGAKTDEKSSGQSQTNAGTPTPTPAPAKTASAQKPAASQVDKGSLINVSGFLKGANLTTGSFQASKSAFNAVKPTPADPNKSASAAGSSPAKTASNKAATQPAPAPTTPPAKKSAPAASTNVDSSSIIRASSFLASLKKPAVATKAIDAAAQKKIEEEAQLAAQANEPKQKAPPMTGLVTQAESKADTQNTFPADILNKSAAEIEDIFSKVNFMRLTLPEGWYESYYEHDAFKNATRTFHFSPPQNANTNKILIIEYAPTSRDKYKLSAHVGERTSLDTNHQVQQNVNWWPQPKN